MFYYNTISVVPSVKSLARQWQKALTAYANMCVTKTDTCMPPAFKNQNCYIWELSEVGLNTPPL